LAPGSAGPRGLGTPGKGSLPGRGGAQAEEGGAAGPAGAGGGEGGESHGGKGASDRTPAAGEAPLTSSARPKRHHPTSSSEPAAAAIFASARSGTPAPARRGLITGRALRHHGDGAWQLPGQPSLDFAAGDARPAPPRPAPAPPRSGRGGRFALPGGTFPVALGTLPVGVRPAWVTGACGGSSGDELGVRPGGRWDCFWARSLERRGLLAKGV